MTIDDHTPFEDFDLEDIFGMLGALGGGYGGLDTMLDDRPDILRRLQALSPQAAAAFGTLLTVPELQASSARIEAMIHLAVANAQGTQAASACLVADLFNHVGSAAAISKIPPKT